MGIEGKGVRGLVGRMEERETIGKWTDPQH